jgi:hypothetical protein
MASRDDELKADTSGPSALAGVPTPFLEAGIQLSLETIARREGIPKIEVLRRIVSRLDEPFRSAALEAICGRRGGQPV